LKLRMFQSLDEEEEQDRREKDSWLQWLISRGEKGWVNPHTSKARGVRITPDFVGPLPSNKRQSYARKVKKSPTFDYAKMEYRLL